MDEPANDGNAPRLTIAQRVSIVREYYRIGDNAAVVARAVSHQLNRNIARKTVANLIRKFELSGTVADAHRPGRPVVATNDTNVSAVLAAVETTPKKSAKRLSLELGTSESVRGCLRSLTKIESFSQ